MTIFLQLLTLFAFLGALAVVACKVAEHNRFMRELEIRQRMYRERQKKLSKLP